MKLCEMSREEIKAVKQQAEQKYNEFKAQGLKLDMSRGKPSPEQLDLTMDMLNVLNKDNLVSESGMDCRNYGGLDGIPEAKKLLAPMVGADESNVIVFGNSSLNIMFWVMQLAFTHGVLGGKPFSQAGKLKFLCPVPGYDRHFAITEFFGFEMINIPMNEDGPDMDMIESLVSEDESIKGIWCVPQYSNPTGISFSDEVVKRFAALKPKAEDFRIYWDNAYTVHYLTDDHSRILNILDEAKKVGNENIVYVFGSTSKITFPGAGVALMAASDENIKSLKKALGFATISYDKLNQMRHAVYFDGKFENLEKHMDLHAKSLAPKFARVLEVLDREIAPLGIGTYTRPKGGYFISFDSLPGCAKRIAALAKEAGVVLTPAGSAFPYGKDENDTNIRIAPSYPTIEDLTKALEVFCECIKIASCEKLLAE
jgi:DNA-binding transcriptional MocR family regulator